MEPLSSGDPRQIGRYRLHGRLGAGGMGEVFWGLSPSGRAVAVKIVRRDLGADPEFRRRFKHEVEAARRVGGFHTAPVVDADPDAEPPWLVIAYVPGPSLANALTRHGPLPERSLRVLGAGLAEALSAVHRAGVVHRDLKPANVLLADDGPRVIDFGIARALEVTAYTSAGAAIGTPGFMAPEQISGSAVTPAADIFALGAVLCHAAGGRPFGEGHPVALMHRVLNNEPDLSALPGGLRDLVYDCLHKDPGRRPTADTLMNLLGDGVPSEGWLPEPVRGMLAEHVLPIGRPYGPIAEQGPPVGQSYGGGGSWSSLPGGPVPPPIAMPPQRAPEKSAEMVVRLKGGLKGWVYLLIGLAMMALAIRTSANLNEVQQSSAVEPDTTAAYFMLFLSLCIGVAGSLIGSRILSKPMRLRVGVTGITLAWPARRVVFPWGDLARAGWGPHPRNLAGGGALLAWPVANSRLTRRRPTSRFWDARVQAFVLVQGARLTRPVVDVQAAIDHFHHVHRTSGPPA